VVTRITQSCLTSWGYEPDSVVGRKLSEFLQPRSVLTTAAAFEEAIKLNRSFSLENELQHANGSIITVHWTGCWSATERSLFCVARDISEQRRLDEAKRQFVAMVSHDLRTPLTSLNVFLQLILAEQVNHETLLKCAQTSKKSVDNLIRLITDLLDFEKLEHGMVPLELRTFKIDIILQSVLDTVRDLALDKGVKISVTASDLEITADQQRLEQVVLNLLSNAIKFSPSGGIVLVAAQKHDDYVKFTVQDQGRGVPKGQQSQIFERFHQVESGDGKRGVGTGLGLAICKALVEQHHGSIGVISEPGQGSTFWFTIPIHRVDQEQSDGGSADEAIRFQPGARQTHTS
jgi:PAS domain S-box-containing protein